MLSIQPPPGAIMHVLSSIIRTIFNACPSIAVLSFLIAPWLASCRIIGIPTVPFAVSNRGEFSMAAVESIIVDSRYATVVDDLGQTLIPPSLQAFAATFAEDLGQILHHQVRVTVGGSCSRGDIFLTISDSKDHVDVAGRKTSEAYSLSVSETGITIAGASPLGVWWGTRTILQQTTLSKGSLPYGFAVDSPGWATRGMMLDVGRHYYPPDFLIEMCSYMSFFKQNTLHLHLSDNLYNNLRIYSKKDSLGLYARFRLWSDSQALVGLNRYKNESYTREQFDEIQSACASRGVTIIPEIEAPGHALVIVQWKPELGREDNLSLLNISHPDTIPTMKLIWKTFLPWFHTRTVHIGADEYTGPVHEYNMFVNEMASYIGSMSNKLIRIWGTFPPRKATGYTSIHQNVSIQHWAYFEDNPYYDYILNNYSVLNSDDAFYVVNKWSGSYPPVMNFSRTFRGNSRNGNAPWYPNVFNLNNETDNPPRSSPLVLGEIAALWNDYGANATVYSEAYYSWREGIPALADKQWGGDLKEFEFTQAFLALHPSIPGQNLDRSISSKTSKILEYKFPVTADNTAPHRTPSITDLSGNGYDAQTTCSLTSQGTLQMTPSCSLLTPLFSKGRNYTLKLSMRLSELNNPTNATLISGSDSALLLTPNITLLASGNYFSLNASLPLHEPLELVIIGRGNQTFATVSSSSSMSTTPIEQEFQTMMGINGESFRWGPIAIEAPLRRVGGDGCGWSGELFGMTLNS
jgi:hexosaminidase